MISYFLEASICMTLFYLFYYALLSQSKLLNLNRAYLLITLLLSITIPTLNFNVGTEPLYAIGNFIPANINTQDLAQTLSHSTGGFSVDPWALIYIIGLSVSLLIFLKSGISLLRLILKQPKKKIEGYWHVPTNGKAICSFFYFILIPKHSELDEASLAVVLNHEKVHGRQWHSLDLILANLVCCLFWFHPAVYAWRKALKLQHEYIADAEALKTAGNKEYTRTLIGYALQQSASPLAHSFSEHPIEKRIKMIDNLKPTIMKKLRPLLSIPLALALVFAFGFTNDLAAQTQEEKIEEQKARLIGALESVKDSKTAPTRLKGRVHADVDGLPLEKVSIMAYPSRTQIKTNDKGLYDFAPAKGDTLIIFSKPGFNKMSIPRKNFSVLNVAMKEKKD